MRTRRKISAYYPIGGPLPFDTWLPTWTVTTALQVPVAENQLAEIRNNKLDLVFQNFNLLPRTSAVENVELPLLYTRDAEIDRRQRALFALRLVGLSDLAHHHPNQLSGGQQQRVAIARSLVNNPEIILGDEPTGALDSRTSIEIMAIFQKLNRDSGITMIIVTHEPDIAAHAGRIIRFKDGRVVEDRTVPEPRNAARELAAMPVEASLEEQQMVLS